MNKDYLNETKKLNQESAMKSGNQASTGMANKTYSYGAPLEETKQLNAESAAKSATQNMAMTNTAPNTTSNTPISSDPAQLEKIKNQNRASEMKKGQ